MNESTAPTRKPRTPKLKIFHVSSSSGIDAYYYAPTTSAARAAATSSIEVREVDAIEFADLIRTGETIHGFEDGKEGGDDGNDPA